MTLNMKYSRPLSTSSLSSSATTTSSTSVAASQNRYSDRFIPSRTGSGDFHSAFELLRRPSSSVDGSQIENSASVSNQAYPPNTPQSPNATAAGNCYSLLLKSELLGTLPSSKPSHLSTPSANPHAELIDTQYSVKGGTSTRQQLHPGLEGLKRLSSPLPHHISSIPSPPVSGNQNIFRFQKQRPISVEGKSNINPTDSLFSVGSGEAKKALMSASTVPGRTSRKIPRAAFKVLDAPELEDDFYINVVDWSSKNVLAVGLQDCVYLWSACTSVVTKLCDLQFGGSVCSVAWSQQGTELAVGTSQGCVQVWDTTTGTLVRTMSGHTTRAGCLAWNSTLLSSGSRDKEIFNRDLRCKEPFIAQLSGHTQEVCGLRWSFDDMQLASGGNDNQLLIWNSNGLGSSGRTRATGSGAAYNSPMLKFTLHEAAVKAIAWSPHARGLLASGGGTADKKIRFWNTMTNSALASVHTGSQVCNMAWSKNVNELVSTHGYSQHQIIVWKYPTLSKVVTLMGHTERVLYLAMSPSGETIVTGAGDETLRFWNVFPKSRRDCSDTSSLLSPGRMSIR